MARQRSATTTSSSAPARRAACSPTGCRADPARARAAARGRRRRTRNFWLRLPVGYFRTIYDPRFSRLFDTEPGEGTGGPQHRLAARPGARRLVVDQRPDLHPRPARGLRRLGARSARAAGAIATCCRTSSAPKRYEGGESEYHGADGELGVSDLRNDHPYCERLGRRPARSSACRSTRTSTRATHVRRRRLPAEHPRRLALRAPSRAFLRPVRRRPNLTVRHRRAGHARPVRGAPRASASNGSQRGGKRASARADARGDPLPPARCSRRSCCSSRASARRALLRSARHRGRSPTRPRSARTCRTTTRRAPSSG